MYKSSITIPEKGHQLSKKGQENKRGGEKDLCL